MRRLLLTATLSSWLFIQSGALGAPANDAFLQAVDQYNKGQYRQALAGFNGLKTKYPNDTKVHYYLALCHQALNHVADARTEYQWVQSNGRDPALKAHAGKGLQVLSQMHSSGSSAANPSPSGGGQLPGGAGPVASGGATKVKKVIEFYADW